MSLLRYLLHPIRVWWVEERIARLLNRSLKLDACIKRLSYDLCLNLPPEVLADLHGEHADAQAKKERLKEKLGELRQKREILIRRVHWDQ